MWSESPNKYSQDISRAKADETLTSVSFPPVSEMPDPRPTVERTVVGTKWTTDRDSSGWGLDGQSTRRAGQRVALEIMARHFAICPAIRIVMPRALQRSAAWYFLHR